MIPLFKPYMPELPELENILKSGVLSYNKWGQKFEKELCSFVGTNELLTTNSYFSAIQIALSALNLKFGDEVIASPMSCLSSNQPLVTYGLKIIWADIDPHTGTLDPESVSKKISKNTKLIFHNHYCGYPGYVNEINAIGKKNGIPIIDDCVEAFGSKYNNNYMGNLGTDISVFSFQTVRLPNTIDGGAVVFKDQKLFEKASLIRDLGIDRKCFRNEYGEISPLCDISLLGYNATLNDVNSYIGWAQMGDIVSLLNKQHQNALKWRAWAAENLDLFFDFDCRTNICPNYWVYGFLVKNKIEVMLHMRKLGYFASGVHLNNNNYSVFGKEESLKGVKEFNSQFLALPSGWWVEL